MAAKYVGYKLAYRLKISFYSYRTFVSPTALCILYSTELLDFILCICAKLLNLQRGRERERERSVGGYSVISFPMNFKIYITRNIRISFISRFGFQVGAA